MQRTVVRHAKPLVDAGVCYGALDVAADVQATELAARALAAHLPMNFVALVSPLQRCRQLAQALQALRADGAFNTDARLAEMNFGKWEGVPWAAIPKDALDAWTADFANHRFGGIESVGEVMHRVAAAWDMQASEQGEVNVWITHAGVARAAALIASGTRHIDRADQWPVTAPAFGECVTLEARSD